MSTNYDAVTKILEEDGDLIVYRKSLRRITESVTATILLQQMIHRSKGKDKIYKFKIPCAHKLYKLGDSWTEELGFSVKEFDNAIKKIGTKITKGVSKKEALKKTDSTGIVIYWTDASRVTWYQLNRDLLGKLLMGIYLEDDQRESTYQTPKGNLPLTESPTESPTETRGDKSHAATNGPTDKPEIDPRSELDLWLGNESGRSTPEDEALREIETVWQKRITQNSTLAISYYYLAMKAIFTDIQIPRDKTTQGKWAAGVKDHLDNYLPADLKELYQLAIRHARDKGWDIYSPHSLTSALGAVQSNKGKSEEYQSDPQYQAFMEEFSDE